MARRVAGAGKLSGSILLYIHVPFQRDADGTLLVEAQAANGLRLWAGNFDHVTVMAPMADGPVRSGWVPWPDHPRVTTEPLPDGYRPDRFLRRAPAQAKRMSRLIDAADYLCFSIGGLFDWGSFAALIAMRKGRSYAAWTDRVESEVTRREGRAAGSFKTRLRARMTAGPMARLEKRVIGAADLGLFHGAETYAAYQALPCHAALVHNIHLSAQDRISAEALAAKRAALRAGPLGIVYAGRAHWSKGWEDWVAALAQLAEAGLPFEAAWLGDGPDLEALRAAVAARGLADRVSVPGFVQDRAAVTSALARAHVVAFCHKTQESPRLLIEALMQGTPILGYADAYARDLLSAHDGGVLVARDDVPALAAELARLGTDRAALDALVARAAEEGARFDDESVFAHRAAEIRAHTAPRRQASTPA